MKSDQRLRARSAARIGSSDDQDAGRGEPGEDRHPPFQSGHDLNHGTKPDPSKQWKTKVLDVETTYPEEVSPMVPKQAKRSFLVCDSSRR